MCKISIIVPVYNVASYLDRCLESLIGQTLKDIDIIIVDDGSTDESYSICERYAASDSRIQLVHKTNGGSSSARNVGLTYVKSDYVAFVDSDDYVAPQMFETLYDKLKSDGLDTVFCGYYSQKPDGRFAMKNETSEYLRFDTHDTVKGFLMDMIGSVPHYSHTARFFMTVWRAIYSMKIINANGVVFKDFTSEDLIFLCDYLTKARKVGFIPECFYYYCWNGNGLSNTYNKSRFKRDVEVYKELHSYLYGQEQKKYKPYLDKYLLLRARVDMSAICGTAIPLEEKKKGITEIIETEELQLVLNSYPYKELRLPSRVMFFLMKERKIAALLAFIVIMRILKK